MPIEIWFPVAHPYAAEIRILGIYAAGSLENRQFWDAVGHQIAAKESELGCVHLILIAKITHFCF